MLKHTDCDDTKYAGRDESLGYTRFSTLSTTKMKETKKITMISRREVGNQMGIPSPQSTKKSLTAMNSILTSTLLHKINQIVMIKLALLQIIPTTLLMMPIFLLLLQMWSMMPGNTTSSKESNTILIITTTTAAHIVAPTKIGNTIFPLSNIQFVKPTDTDT